MQLNTLFQLLAMPTALDIRTDIFQPIIQPGRLESTEFSILLTVNSCI